MANKLSDVLQMISNTQIRDALLRFANLCGVTSDSTDDSALVTDVTGDVTGNVTGDLTGSVRAANTANIIAGGATARFRVYIGTITSGIEDGLIIRL